MFIDLMLGVLKWKLSEWGLMNWKSWCIKIILGNVLILRNFRVFYFLVI